MKILLRSGRYALIDRGHEYVVACGFDGEEWSQGYYYTHWNESETRIAYCLNASTEHFLSLVDENHISRVRLEELATKFKDGLFECDEDYAIEFCQYDCELTENEYEWLGITESEEDEDV